MQSKTTRAFRTISEAAEELDLQPHVLRFWESKFSQIRPIKRAGGRRLYRAEDIDLLRGIKMLLHKEKHPIKDVQKIIRLKGHNQVIELGRSVKRAALPKDVTDTVLVPDRIAAKALPTPPKASVAKTGTETAPPVSETVTAPASGAPSQTPPTEPFFYRGAQVLSMPSSPSKPFQDSTSSTKEQSSKVEVSELEAILTRLQTLRKEWDNISLKTDQ